jgi:hypothetical protein
VCLPRRCIETTVRLLLRVEPCKSFARFLFGHYGFQPVICFSFSSCLLLFLVPVARGGHVTLPPLPSPLLAEYEWVKVCREDLLSGTAGVRSVFQQQGCFRQNSISAGILFKICFRNECWQPTFYVLPKSLAVRQVAWQ